MATARPEVASPGVGMLDPRLPWLALVWVSAMAVVLVAMAEISRLSGSVLDTRSQAWAFGELMGPSAWPSRIGWTAVFGPESVRPAALRLYLGLNLAFIGLYALALGRIITHRYQDGLRIGLICLLGALVDEGPAHRVGSLTTAQSTERRLRPDPSARVCRREPAEADVLWCEAVNQMALTLSACGPFGPWVVSNSTR